MVSVRKFGAVLLILCVSACGGESSNPNLTNQGGGNTTPTNPDPNPNQPTLPPLSADKKAVLWSNFRLNNGQRPGQNDVVVVPQETRLILDQDAQVEGLVVLGEFFAQDQGKTAAPLSLQLGWGVAMRGGSFNVGWADSPYQGEFTLTLVGDDPEQNVVLANYVPNGPTLQKQDAFLMAMGEGASLSLMADDALKKSWVQLGQTAQAGENTITLAERTGWKVGDLIAIASTDFDLNQAEKRTITAVSSDGLTLALDTPLQFMHFGEVETHSNGLRTWELDMRAEVGLLSRDVTIQGPTSATNTLYGGHTMVMDGAQMQISGIELTRMGQLGLIGKYPVHWHELGETQGQFVRNSSFHQTYNKGITVHNTSGVEVANNVTFETVGHSYYIESGRETNNLFKNNLGINTRAAPSETDAAVKSDFNQPSTFWIKNPTNRFIGNHAAGSEQYGFWTDAIRVPTGITEFADNTAHSTQSRGFFLNHGGGIQDRNPSGTAQNPQRIAPWQVERFTTYKSDGVYVRGVNGVFNNSMFAEMGSNARFRLNQTIQDSLIIGRSSNTGTPTTPEELAAGRSLPGGSQHFEGFQLYDGPGGLNRVHFDGFEPTDRAIALSNAIHKTSMFFVNGITWGRQVAEEAKLQISGGGNAIGNDAWARAIVDIDGSLTGTAGAMVYQHSKDRDGSEAFNAGEQFEIKPLWGAIITKGQQSATLRIDSNGTPETNHGGNTGNPLNNSSVTRSDGLFATKLRNQIPVFDGYEYTLDFDSLAQDTFRLYLHDAHWEQSFVVHLGPTPIGSSFTVDNPNSDDSRLALEVSSLDELRAAPSTAIYRNTDSNEVTVKLVAEMAHGYLWPQPGETFENSLHSGVTVLVNTQPTQ